jgi:hypothetical protein
MAHLQKIREMKLNSRLKNRRRLRTHGGDFLVLSPSMSQKNHFKSGINLNVKNNDVSKSVLSDDMNKSVSMYEADSKNYRTHNPSVKPSKTQKQDFKSAIHKTMTDN